MIPLSKLGIGSAAFGMDYGVTNPRGRVGDLDLRDILSRAAGEGVGYIDTAAQYGEAEAALGAVLETPSPFRIVTKTGALPGPVIDAAAVDAVIRDFHMSLDRLGVDRVYALMVHQAGDLVKPGGDLLAGALASLKAEGRVAKIGVSVYDADQVHAAAARLTPDILQVPVNPFNQDLMASGLLRDLHDRGVEIHARSLFLQGLMLATPEALPDFFAPMAGHLAGFRNWLEEQDLTPLEACLLFADQAAEIDALIVGVTDAEQLAEICAALRNVSGRRVDFTAWCLTDTRFTNPANWPPRAELSGTTTENKRAVH